MSIDTEESKNKPICEVVSITLKGMDKIIPGWDGKIYIGKIQEPMEENK